MFILILLVFIKSSFGYYILESDVTNCGRKTVYSHERLCPSKCFKALEDLNCNYTEVCTTEVDDRSKPIFEKDQIVNCLDAETCRDDYKEFTCTDPEKLKDIDLDNLQLFCFKVLGYSKKNIKVLVNNSGLKAAYENNKSTKLAEETAIEDRLKDMEFGRRIYAIVQLSNKQKGLSIGQRRTLRANLSSIRDDLIDGNICDAKADISAISPDGTLITQSDIDSVTNEINGYKSCD